MNGKAALDNEPAFAMHQAQQTIEHVQQSAIAHVHTVEDRTQQAEHAVCRIEEQLRVEKARLEQERSRAVQRAFQDGLQEGRGSTTARKVASALACSYFALDSPRGRVPSDHNPSKGVYQRSEPQADDNGVETIT